MYDAFISYSSQDIKFAKDLATKFTSKGVRVWFADWEMKPGESLMTKISKAIQTSSYLFVLLSPASVQSKWVAQELRQAMADEICTYVVKVVPIIVETCQIPTFLQDKLYVDFVDISQSEEYNIHKLVDVVFEIPTQTERPAIQE